MNKKQAIMYAANGVVKSYNGLGQTIIASNRELGNKLESISKAEIKSKDRVDITLEEYENMKRQISSLTSEVNWLRSILNRIEAPIDKNIVPDSVRTYCRDDILNFNRRVYVVEFAIDGHDL